MDNTFDIKHKFITLDTDDINLVLELENYEKQYNDIADEMKKLQFRGKQIQDEIESRRRILARRIKLKIDALRDKGILK